MSYYDDWVDPHAFFKGGWKLDKNRTKKSKTKKRNKRYLSINMDDGARFWSNTSSTSMFPGHRLADKPAVVFPDHTEWWEYGKRLTDC